MLDAFRDHQLRVDPFEIGNELDWGAFNGDLVNHDAAAPSLSAMQQTVAKDAEIFKLAHRLIRNDATHPRAKLITFGFANPDPGYLTRPRSAGGLGMDPQRLPIIPPEFASENCWAARSGSMAKCDNRGTMRTCWRGLRMALACMFTRMTRVPCCRTLPGWLTPAASFCGSPNGAT